jgi:HEAT repeat protein
MTDVPPILGHRYLKQMAESGDVEGLIDALDDRRVQRSPSMRRKVVSELGLLGDSSAVGPLSEVLVKDTDASTCGLAARALGRIGDPAARPALRQTLERGPSAPNKMWSIQSLGRLKDRESVDLILMSLKDESTGVRIFAARALGEIGDQRAFPGLTETLRDPKSAVCAAAAEALVNLRDSRALEALREAYKHSGLLARFRLKRYLRQLEDSYNG